MADAAKKPLIIKLLIAAAILLAVVIGMRIYSAGDRAPLTDFRLIDGRTVRTDTFRGKVLVVNFWATNCSPCVAEMPHLVDSYERFHDRGFDIIAVAMSYDRPDYVVNFANARNLPFSVAYDATGGVAHSWGQIRSTPTTFVIDRKGHVVEQFVGMVNMEQFNRLIDELL